MAQWDISSSSKDLQTEQPVSSEAEEPGSSTNGETDLGLAISSPAGPARFRPQTIVKAIQPLGTSLSASGKPKKKKTQDKEMAVCKWLLTLDGSQGFIESDFNKQTFSASSGTPGME